MKRTPSQVRADAAMERGWKAMQEALAAVEKLLGPAEAGRAADLTATLMLRWRDVYGEMGKMDKAS